jgi:hypothetical protein
VSTEAFLVRTVNGPRPGTRVAEGWAWPLPVLLLAEGGQYVKISESSLEPQVEDSNVLRGAEYRWQPGDPTAGQLTSAVAVEIRAKRFDAVEALLILLAVKDPQSAGTIRDTIIALAEPRPGE